MAEDYAAKMSRKTQAELLLYVQNHAEYREEAVLAALDELEARGLRSAAEDAELRASLLIGQQETERRETELRQQATEQQQARRRMQEGEVPAEAEPTGPPLYSPGTIALFSLLPMSMMIGGGVLLGMNLFRLRRIRPLLGLVLFIVAYMLIGSRVLAYSIIQYGLDPFIGVMLFNIPALIVYLRWFWPRYISVSRYRSRSILPPIIICFLVMWGLQKALPYLIKQQPKEVQQEMEKMMKN